MIFKLFGMVSIVVFSLKFIQLILSSNDIISLVQTVGFWVFLVVYIIVIFIAYQLKKLDEYGGEE